MGIKSNLGTGLNLMPTKIAIKIILSIRHSISSQSEAQKVIFEIAIRKGELLVAILVVKFLSRLFGLKLLDVCTMIFCISYLINFMQNKSFRIIMLLKSYV